MAFAPQARDFFWHLWPIGPDPPHVDLAETSVARGHLGRSRVKECCLMHQLSVWNIKTYILPKLKKYNFQRKTLFVENRAPGGYLDRFSNSCVLRWKNRFLQFWENVGFYVTKWFLVHQTTPLDPWLVQVTPRRPCSDIQLLNRRAPPPLSTWLRGNGGPVILALGPPYGV